MSARPAGGTPSEAFLALVRAAAAAAARVNRRLAEHGLTSSRFGTLCALMSEGPLCPHDIATRLGQTRGNVTMILDDLEKRGLVERRGGGVNRRYRVIHLTARGRKVVDALRPLHKEAVSEALGCLRARELKEVTSICR